MMRRATLLVAVGVSVLALVVGAALATPPSGQTSTLLARATPGKFEELLGPRFSARDSSLTHATYKGGQRCRSRGRTLAPVDALGEFF
jgi:hypothetical protein